MAQKIRLAGIISSAMVFISLMGISTMASDIKESGNRLNQTRRIAGYSSIKLDLPADLIVNGATGPALSIEADENLLPHITTTVRNGELVISSDQSFYEAKHIIIRARVGNISRLTITHAGGAVVNGLHENNFNVITDGAASITASGRVGKLSVSIKGAGDLEAGQLTAHSVAVSISGPGSATVNATNYLNATVTGAGSVKYKGNPKITKRISGIGSLEQI